MKRPGLLQRLFQEAPPDQRDLTGDHFDPLRSDTLTEPLPPSHPRGWRPTPVEESNANYDLRKYDALRVELLTLEKRLKHAQETIPNVKERLALQEASLIARGVLDKNGKRKRR